MTKFMPVIFMLLMLLACIGFSACGNADKSTTTVAQTQPTKNFPTGITAPTAKPASGGGGNWGDIPLYPGSKEIMKVKSDEDEIIDGKPAVYEKGMYTTSDKRSDVAAFYKEKMPANGWNETDWTEAKVSSIGQYDKNDRQAIAVISCSETEKGTLIQLDRKYLK